MEIQKRLVSMAALVLAACAQQPTAPTSATASSSLRGQGEGALQIQAVGDVKNGPIDIVLVYETHLALNRVCNKNIVIK